VRRQRKPRKASRIWNGAKARGLPAAPTLEAVDPFDVKPASAWWIASQGGAHGLLAILRSPASGIVRSPSQPQGGPTAPCTIQDRLSLLRHVHSS
jgi:hypothetical protein